MITSALYLHSSSAGRGGWSTQCTDILPRIPAALLRGREARGTGRGASGPCRRPPATGGGGGRREKGGEEEREGEEEEATLAPRRPAHSWRADAAARRHRAAPR